MPNRDESVYPVANEIDKVAKEIYDLIKDIV
jgi:hypothetical protein